PGGQVVHGSSPSSRASPYERSQEYSKGGNAMTEPFSPAAPPGAPAPLASVHTSNLPGLLRRLGVSLLVTTYQAGRLVVLRTDGDALNTHFRVFPKPMGLAVQGDRLAVGTAMEIWEYHNVPAVA